MLNFEVYTDFLQVFLIVIKLLSKAETKVKVAGFFDTNCMNVSTLDTFV